MISMRRFTSSSKYFEFFSKNNNVLNSPKNCFNRCDFFKNALLLVMKLWCMLLLIQKYFKILVTKPLWFYLHTLLKIPLLGHSFEFIISVIENSLRTLKVFTKTTLRQVLMIWKKVVRSSFHSNGITLKEVQYLLTNYLIHFVFRHLSLYF